MLPASSSGVTVPTGDISVMPQPCFTLHLSLWRRGVKKILTGNRKKGGKLKLEKCCHLNVSNHTFNLQSHIKTSELCIRKVHCIKSHHFKNNTPQRNTHQHQTNSYLSATILCTSNPSGAAPLIRLSMEDKSYWSIMGCLASARAIGGTI